MVTISKNTDKGGIELSFPGKPTDEILAWIKAHGYAWSKFNKIWWKKFSDNSWQLVHEYFDQPIPGEPASVKTPESIGEPTGEPLFYGITADEFILLDITASLKSFARNEALKRNKIFEKKDNLKASLIKKKLMLKNGAINDMGRTIRKNIIAGGDYNSGSYYSGYDKIINAHWKKPEEQKAEPVKERPSAWITPDTQFSPIIEKIKKQHPGTEVDLAKQIDLGRKIESEHTNDATEAIRITYDHLWEDPKYYTKAKPANWAEKELEKENKPEKDFIKEHIIIGSIPKVEFKPEKISELTKGSFYLRFTDDPSADLEHKYSRWYMDDMELEAAIERGLKEGKDYFKDNAVGEYFKLHTGLSGHKLESETLAGAIKEVESKNNWFRRADEDSWAIFEDDESVFSVKQDTPEGNTFYPYKVHFFKEYNKTQGQDYRKIFLREQEGLKLYLVDGEQVRKDKIMFVSGGHGYVYDWIPKDEVWIDDNQKDKPADMEATIKHELFEIGKMRDEGLDYESAHELANKMEKKVRQEAKLDTPESKIAFLKTISFIETGEKKTDNDYEPDDAEYNQRKVFVPVYFNLWHYADNTDPDSESFIDIDEAISDLPKPGRGEPDKYFTPVKEMRLYLQEQLIDSKGDVADEGKIFSYKDFIDKYKDNDFVKQFGIDDLITDNSFISRESTAETLLNEVYFGIDKDLIKQYEENGVKLNISTQKQGKYRTINVENEQGDEVGSIKLRIADHSYNPANNDVDAQSGNFISVEIANKNETAGRFHGKFGIQFTGDDNYNDVIDAVNERVKEIIDRWDIKPLVMEKEFKSDKFLSNITELRKFVSGSQIEALMHLIRSEEREAGLEIVDNLINTIKTMPKTYETEKIKTEDKIVYLHYFKGGSDFYIVERDKEVIQHHAFGYSILNQDYEMAEWGYISIVELIQNNVELDFYWTPKKFSEVKKKWSSEEEKTEKPATRIVVEWSEGKSGRDFPIKDMDELQVFLREAGKTDNPKNTYIKNKILFDGKPYRVDVGEMTDDFDYEKENIMDYLKRVYPDKGWSIYESPQSVNSSKYIEFLEKLHELDLWKEFEWPIGTVREYRKFILHEGNERAVTDLGIKESLKDVTKGGKRYTEAIISIKPGQEDLKDEIEAAYQENTGTKTIIQPGVKALPIVRYNDIEYFVDWKLQEVRNIKTAQSIKFTDIHKDELKAAIRFLRANEGPNVSMPGLDEPESEKKDILKESSTSKVLIDTHNQKFEFLKIKNRRFTYCNKTGELVLGGNNIDISSHSQEHFDLGVKSDIDNCSRGWMGTGKDYPDGIIHFAPNYTIEMLREPQYFNEAFDTLEMILKNGANYNTIVRGFGKVHEQKISDIMPEKKTEPTKATLSTSDYKNEFELNKAIESLLDKKWNDKTDTWSAEELQFIKGYTGYGGLDKFGEITKASLFEYFTPDQVIEKMWGLAYKYGYKDGPVLEPSCGIGPFFDRRFVSNLIEKTGYEINKYSARIAKLLYPEANINDGQDTKYFEQLFIVKNYTVRSKVMPRYQLVIGNPPYGTVGGIYMGMGEKSYTHANNYIDYFILRGLDLLQKDGLLIFIIGAETASGGVPFLDQNMNKVKEMINERGRLIDAYRLPSGVFLRTDVTSDIVIFRKK